jgi:hypothetical protein
MNSMVATGPCTCTRKTDAERDAERDSQPTDVLFLALGYALESAENWDTKGCHALALEELCDAEKYLASLKRQQVEHCDNAGVFWN